MNNRLLIIVVFFCIAIKALPEVKTYKFNDIFTISVSDILELRKEDDLYTNYLADTLKYHCQSDIIFQQKGLSVKDPLAMSRYCRIMIKTDYDESCPYPCPDEETFSDDDIKDLLSECDGELGPGQRYIEQPTAKIQSTVNGYRYILIHYIRSGYKGNVCVNICYFFNYKYGVKTIFSYRVSESNLWQSAINRSIESFSWSNPYVSHNYSIDYTENDNNNLNNKSKNKVQYLSSIIIAILLILVFVSCLIYSKILNNKRRVENELSKINKLIITDRIVSANKLITSLKKEDTSIISDYNIIQETNDKVQGACNKINKSIDIIVSEIQDNLINNGIVEFNTTKVRDFNNNKEIPYTKKKKLEQRVSSIEEQYKQGIIPKQQECYTKYELPCSSKFDTYPFFTSPTKCTIVFPYRRRKVELRGYTEKLFENILRTSLLENTHYKVLGDVSILTADGCRPYEPDISIVEIENKYGVRIDIEIDEPYDGYENKPIHYIGCGDEFRDKNLANHGWIVVRFSEKQIYKEPLKCINYIMYILSLIDHTIEIINDFPSPDKRWTEIEAKIMAVNGFREKLLNHRFGRVQKKSSNMSIVQTKEEKCAAHKVKPLIIPLKKQINLDNSSILFEQDTKLSFEPKEHIYIYNGERNLIPVSTVINYFFESFDSIGLSEKVAKRDGKEQSEVLEEWDCKGCESREVGTFMHTQIESYFSGKPMVDQTIFSYKGNYININKKVSIKDEITYFTNFLRNNNIMPFRTEWHIFDLELGIAGTIDLLCRNGNGFDMYDWKRSRKASPNETVWRNGKNGLNHVPDINYYHYAIQQNLYRYILEKNYGIVINNMSIVVLHPIYNDYRKYVIPKMDKEIRIIINHLCITN